MTNEKRGGLTKISFDRSPFKGTVSQDFLLQVFFHESPSPKPLKITLWSIRFFPFATGVVDIGGAPWAANISANFRKKFEMAVMVYSDVWGKLIHEKARSRKSRDTVPLSCSRWNFQTNWCRPHPVRGLKLLSEPSFCRWRLLSNNSIVSGSDKLFTSYT